MISPPFPAGVHRDPDLGDSMEVLQWVLLFGAVAAGLVAYAVNSRSRGPRLYLVAPQIEPPDVEVPVPYRN